MEPEPNNTLSRLRTMIMESVAGNFMTNKSIISHGLSTDPWPTNFKEFHLQNRMLTPLLIKLDLLMPDLVIPRKKVFSRRVLKKPHFPKIKSSQKRGRNMTALPKSIFSELR